MGGNRGLEGGGWRSVSRPPPHKIAIAYYGERNVHRIKIKPLRGTILTNSEQPPTFKCCWCITEDLKYVDSNTH